MNNLGYAGTNTFVGDVLMEDNLQVDGDVNIDGTLTAGTIIGTLTTPFINVDLIKPFTANGDITVKNSVNNTIIKFDDTQLVEVSSGIKSIQPNLSLSSRDFNASLIVNNGSAIPVSGCYALPQLATDKIISVTSQTLSDPSIQLSNNLIEIQNANLKTNSYTFPTTAPSVGQVLTATSPTSSTWTSLTGISNVVQQVSIYSMPLSNPLIDFDAIENTGSITTDGNIFYNFPVNIISNYPSGNNGNNYTFSNDTTGRDYIVFGASPATFPNLSFGAGPRTTPQQLAGGSTSSNIAHLFRTIQVTPGNNYSKVFLRMAFNSSFNGYAISLFANYQPNPTVLTPSYEFSYFTESVAANNNTDIFINNNAFQNTLTPLLPYTSIRPNVFQYDFPLNISAINKSNQVSICLSISYSNGGLLYNQLQAPGSLFGANNYTNAGGLILARFEIIGETISGGTGTLTTDHDLLSNLNTQSHGQYLTIDGTRPLTGDWDLSGAFDIKNPGPYVGNIGSGLVNLQLTKASNSIIYQPGGVSLGNTYATWAEIVTICGLADGCINVIVDDSITSPAMITQNLDCKKGRVTFTAALNIANSVKFNFDTDIQLTDPGTFSGVMELSGNSVTLPNIVLSLGQELNFKGGVAWKIGVSSLVPNLTISSSNLCVVGFQEGANMSNISAPTVANILVDVNATCIFAMSNIFNRSAFTNDTIASTDSSASLLKIFDSTFLENEITFSNFTGSVNYSPISLSQGVFYNDSVTPNYGSTNVQGVLDTLKQFGSVVGSAQSNALSWNSSTSKFETRGSSVYLGEDCGANPGNRGVGIGYHAASNNQGDNAVAIGTLTGSTSSGSSSVAIGNGAGNANSGSNSIAIGTSAASSNSGASSICIGDRAVISTSAGANGIFIGRLAGSSQADDNSIVLNASGSTLNTVQASSFYVKPIRNVGSTQYLLYDPSTSEITYNSTFADYAISYVTEGSILAITAGTWTPYGMPATQGLTSSNFTFNSSTMQWTYNGPNFKTFQISSDVALGSDTSTIIAPEDIFTSFSINGSSPTLSHGQTYTIVWPNYTRISWSDIISLNTGDTIDLNIYNDNASTNINFKDGNIKLVSIN